MRVGASRMDFRSEEIGGRVGASRMDFRSEELGGGWVLRGWSFDQKNWGEGGCFEDGPSIRRSGGRVGVSRIGLCAMSCRFLIHSNTKSSKS